TATPIKLLSKLFQRSTPSGMPSGGLASARRLAKFAPAGMESDGSVEALRMPLGKGTGMAIAHWVVPKRPNVVMLVNSPVRSLKAMGQAPGFATLNPAQFGMPQLPGVE